jgi:HNH endonuclease/NUMOD4 motif
LEQKVTKVKFIETWRAVVGFEGFYEVSNRGTVRSLPRDYCRGQVIKPRWRGRYLAVVLSTPTLRKELRVHRLVGEAFLGPRPDKHETRHLDDNRANNNLTNLVYGTSKENSQDSIRNGGTLFGLLHQNCFISDELVAEILTLPRGSRSASAETVAQWADRKGISRGHVYNIRAGFRRKNKQ